MERIVDEEVGGGDGREDEREKATHELESDLHGRRERSPVMKERDRVYDRDGRTSLRSDEDSIHEKGRVLREAGKEEVSSTRCQRSRRTSESWAEGVVDLDLTLAA